MNKLFMPLGSPCRPFLSAEPERLQQNLLKTRSKVDKEQLSWNIKQNFGHLSVPVPSRSQVKRLFSMALNQNHPSYKPTQKADLSSRKAKVKSKGFEKCHFGFGIKKLNRDIFNSKKSKEKKNPVSNEMISMKAQSRQTDPKRKGYSTEASLNDELNKDFEESEAASLCPSRSPRVDPEQLDYERREKQRVSEAKKMVREVMKNIKENRKMRVQELFCLQKSGRLIDFEYDSIMKSIKKSKTIQNRVALYSKKIQFFLSKTERRVRKSLLNAKKTELNQKVAF